MKTSYHTTTKVGEIMDTVLQACTVYKQ